MHSEVAASLKAFRAALRPTREHLGLVLVLPALAHLIALAVIVAGRLFYPMDIEWMEGGVLTMASRMQHGLPVYAAPELGYVPFPYPFAYPLLLALLGSLVGQSYALGRAISIGFCVLAFVLLGREVARAHQGWQYRWGFGLAAAGFAAAGFPVVDAWYDLVRVDSMAVALVVASAVLVTPTRLTRQGLWMSAAALALAASTKQTVAPFVVAIVLYGVWRHGRRGLGHAGLALGLFVLSFAVAELVTGRQYAFYTVTLMAGHRMDLPRIAEGLGTLLRFAPYAPLLPVGAVSLAWQRKLSRRSVLWVSLAFIGWGFGALGMAKDGAHVNSLLPAVWFTPTCFLLLCGDVFGALGKTGGARVWRPLAPFGIAVGLCFSWYPMREHWLSDAAWRRAYAVDTYVRSLPGKVHATTIPFVASRNGKGFDQMHAQSLGDLKWAKLPYRERYAVFLEHSAPDYVIASGRETGIELLYERFALVAELGADEYDVTTSVGWRVRPRWVFARPTATPRARVLFDFEGSLEGWRLKNFRATARPPRGQGHPWGGHGRVLNSFHQRLGDGARGQAVSPSFAIDRSCFRFGVGGGADPRTRVELRVDGKAVRRASGLAHEALRLVDWDVSPFRGREAQLWVMDASRESWGYVTLDNVVLHDGCGRR